MKNRRAGFSIIEATVAAIIIAIIAVVALLSMMYCNRIALQADERLTAANFARETIEKLYKKDYSSSELNAVVDAPDALPTGTEFGSEFLKKYPTATRTYTVTDKPDYKLITVKVSWTRS